ncbi:hypothetical protein Tco_0987492 [Tanacetum coccineum]
MRLKHYAFVVGSLTYAQVCTHPDIAYITGMLGHYQSNPGNLEVVGYSDFNYPKCKDSSRSTSGYIFMLSGGPISWRSHKQELTTTSTMMAEYTACYHATSHAILLRNLISGVKVVYSISRPIRLYCDNSSKVRFSNITSSTGGDEFKHGAPIISSIKMQLSLIDPRICNSITQEAATNLIMLAVDCIHTDLGKRPNAAMVS